MTTTITSTDTTTITTQPRKICSPSFEPPQTMKTTEEMAHEYAEALDDIADLLDMPTGATSTKIVKAARKEWANGIHTCHDQCSRAMCALRRERDAFRDALKRIVHNPGWQDPEVGFMSGHIAAGALNQFPENSK